MDIAGTLRALRRQSASSPDTLGSHQLDAHWSLAFACGGPPEAWEMYRAPALHLMPSTEFYAQHRDEIEEELRNDGTDSLLADYGSEKLALEAQMTERDRREHHSFATTVQYYDSNQESWVQTDVPAIQWFDSRDVFRESLEGTREELKAKVETRLAKLKQRAEEDPQPRRLDEYRSYEKYTRGQFQVYLQEFDRKKFSLRAYLEKLETTRDFSKAVFGIVRGAENRVRAAHGIAKVGEAWVSETELLYRVRRLLPDQEVVGHASPRWLGRQHFDIWIPALLVAIEYQGIQHFQPVARFGGEAAFLRAQERDHRKRELCLKNGVRLVEVVYDCPVEDAKLRELLAGPRRC